MSLKQLGSVEKFSLGVGGVMKRDLRMTTYTVEHKPILALLSRL